MDEHWQVVYTGHPFVALEQQRQHGRKGH